MKIAIDFDGTICDTNSEKASWIKQELGFEVKPYLCDRTCCTELIGDKEYSRMSAYVYSTETTWKTQPIYGALKVISKLRARHQILIVTARTGQKLEAAIHWLERYRETRDLTCYGVDTDQVSKGELCQHEGAQALLDDDERHVYRAIALGVKGVLFKNSAPTSFQRPGLTVCKSWKEVVALWAGRVRRVDRLEDETKKKSP